MQLLQVNTNQILKTIAIDGVNPGVNDDVTAGFVVGSRWETVDGTIYECTDATEDNAVWEARTVASQQVHWQELLDLQGTQGTKLPSYEIEGNWPMLSTIVREDINIPTTIRLLLKAPKLTGIVATGDGGGLDSTALANLLADVARNADEFTIEDGTLDMSGNPGTLDTSDSEIAANLAILDDLDWTVTYPIPGEVTGSGTMSVPGAITINVASGGNTDTFEVRYSLVGSEVWTTQGITNGEDITGLSQGQLHNLQFRSIWYGVAGSWSTNSTAIAGVE
jgi:hypothetical protein